MGIDIVDEERFEEAKKLAPLPRKDNVVDMPSEAEFKELVREMQNPVRAQQRLAVQIKTFLDRRIGAEMAKSGYLSDATRRWVDTYNSVLEKIQRALHGDKSVNLHLHKVSHSEIAAKMRDVKITLAEPKKEEKKEQKKKSKE